MPEAVAAALAPAGGFCLLGRLWMSRPGTQSQVWTSSELGAFTLGCWSTRVVPVSPRDWRWDNRCSLMAAGSFPCPNLGHTASLQPFPAFWHWRMELQVQGSQTPISPCSCSCRCLSLCPGCRGGPGQSCLASFPGVGTGPVCDCCVGFLAAT